MLLSRPLRFFFGWLYHQLAFTYDLVAAAVSLGHWNDWVRSVLPWIQGDRTLELGHGPGYLQLALRKRAGLILAVEESAQMSRMARTRLHKSGHEHLNLVRGIAQALPFASSSFDTVVSTFPSEYIFDPRTLTGVRRLLRPGGRLVVLPVAWPSNRMLAWLFKFTGEAPAEALKTVDQRLSKPFLEAGFEVELQHIDVKSGRLLIIIAR